MRGRIGAVVVDDDDDARALLATALRRDGRFDVLGEAADGQSAIGCARELHPDLLLLDLAMPGMGGLEALPLLRRVSPETRVVVVSGFPNDRLEAVTRSSGAVGYVSKGLSPRRTVEEIVAVAGVIDSIQQVLPSRATTLGQDVRSGAVARRFMEETLEGWGDTAELLDVVNLLVTELVTNAVIHAGTEADVAVVLTPTALRVEVSDASEELPRTTDADDWDTSGRGVSLVDTLAERWGIDLRPGGKTIWFELARPDVS
jgi:DNA-binding NarL/FixJ family response regulator